MKKRIIIISFVMIMLFTGIVYGNPNGDLISKLPSYVNAIGYINIKNTIGLDLLNNQFSFLPVAEVKYIIDNFNDLIVGLNFNNTYSIPELVIFLKGKYDKGEYLQKIKSAFTSFEQVKINDVDCLLTDGATFLFISPDVVALTNPGLEETVIDAFKNGINSINKDSALYKNSIKMNNDIGWLSSELDFLGEFNLNNLNIPALKGIVSFDYFLAGISKKKDALSVSLNINLNDNEVATSIANFLNTQVPLLSTMITSGIENETLSLINNDKELTNDIIEIINGINFKTSKKELFTSFNVKLSTLEKLSELLNNYMGEWSKVEEESWYTTNEDGLEEEWLGSEPTEEKDFTLVDGQIDAEEVINLINEGYNVYYENVEIIGNIDFTSILDTVKTSRKIFTGYINSSITFIDCVFSGDVLAYGGDGDYFFNTVFKKNVSFIGSKFNGKVDFNSAKFEDIVDFNGSYFLEDANFEKTEFEGKVNFIGAKFSKTIDFYLGKFSSKTSFEKAEFYGFANFKNANFPGYVVFREANFRDISNFKEVQFLESATFDNSKFAGRVTFTGSVFSKKAIFYGVEFSDITEFCWVSFYGLANFKNALFRSDVDFGKAIFGNDAYFGEVGFSIRPNEAEYSDKGKAEFLGNVYFGLTQFSGSTFFGGVKFGKDTYFYGSRFLGYADFRSCSFVGEANFGLTQFSADAYYGMAEFSGKANFREALFSAKAHFGKTIFKSEVTFSEAQMSGYAYFSEAQFYGKSYFEKTQFTGYAYFKKAIFKDDVSFKSSIFKTEANFDDVKFEKKADFTGATVGGKPYNPLKK